MTAVPAPTDGESIDWVVAAARAADDKLAKDTLIIDVGDVLSITDHFVIASGANSRQVRAIAEEIEAVIKARGGPSPNRTEGTDTSEWILLDYGEFVVHVFIAELRDFYQLERLWGDRPKVDWEVA